MPVPLHDYTGISCKGDIIPAMDNFIRIMPKRETTHFLMLFPASIFVFVKSGMTAGANCFASEVEMRRKDREETSQAFFDEVFNAAEDLFLAINDAERPYGIILNFAREGDSIYIHSASAGKKIDLIRADGNVSFCLACDVCIDQPKSTTHYKSVYGTGAASIVEDEAEKCHALDLLALRYDAMCPVPADAATANRVAIIKIAIASLTGKKN